MRFFKCAVIAFAALEAILVNAACRDTDIYVIDAIIRETKELWAWNVQTRPENADERHRNILREPYEEQNYPFFFQKLLAQLCDAFAACTGNVNEDYKLGCLKNGLHTTMLQAEDTASLMAGRVKDYINQLVSSESTKNEEVDVQRGEQMNDQSSSPDNKRDNEEPS